jgi:hypothetical protein
VRGSRGLVRFGELEVGGSDGLRSLLSSFARKGEPSKESAFVELELSGLARSLLGIASSAGDVVLGSVREARSLELAPTFGHTTERGIADRGRVLPSGRRCFPFGFAQGEGLFAVFERGARRFELIVERGR